MIAGLLAMIAASACSKKEVSGTGKKNGVIQPHHFYVAEEGADVADGSIRTPWRTINNALSKIRAGDTVIVRGGTYSEKITFPRSGLPGKPVVLIAHSGERPLIDGSNLPVNGWEALVTFTNARYIEMNGFDIANFKTSVKGADPEGIRIDGNAKGISIRNCAIYQIQNEAPLEKGRSAHAILVLGNGTAAITGIEITGCTVHDTKTGTSENITLAGNLDGFKVTRNKVYNTENIGIIIADGGGLYPKGDPATNFARNGVVSDNILYNVSMANSVDIWGNNNYGAIAIYVCGGADAIVERNVVHDCDRGIGLVSENNARPTQTTTVRNNFVYNNWRTGIYLGDYLNFTTAGTYNCYIVNNTLFQNNKAAGAFGEIEGEIRLTERCFNNVILNNLVYARYTDAFIHKYTTTGGNNVMDHNLYYTKGTPQWFWNTINDKAVTGFSTWQAISGMDVHSIYGKDPLLISSTVPDLHIESGSPAHNAGIFISAAINGATDIDGNPRAVNGQISIGAQQ